MSDKTYFGQTISWTIVTNMSIDFLSQSNTHFSNITFSVVLICLTHQKHDFRKDKSNIILYHFHVLWISLESMNKNPEMNSVFIIFWKLTLNLLLLGFNSQLLNVSNEAFFKNYGLQVLKISKSLFGLKFFQFCRKSLASGTCSGMDLVRNLNNIEISIGALHQYLITFFSFKCSSFHSHNFMNFLNIFLTTWSREIFGLKYSPINEFTPVFTHFFFVDYS